MQIDDLYPLTIVLDRYCGTYSGGKYTAWNLDASEVPPEIYSDDVTCAIFWSKNNFQFGIGCTPENAIEDLKEKIYKNKSW